MSIACGLPDTSMGIGLRLSGYLDCQARALGEDGFQAMIGGPVAGGLLNGIVTLFVALIGYRLMLGRRTAVGDAIGWAVRLGIVLALVTGWPAFQTLIYRVAVDTPGELATVILPAAGLPSEALGGRVQAAYDTIRLGGGASAPDQQRAPDRSAGATDPSSGAAAAASGPAGLGAGQAQRPNTALLFVLSTLGMTAALKIVVGFLLAIAPLAIMTLLFDATLGVFAGWAGVLAGTALAVLASTILTALELMMVETEIASLQAYSRGMVTAIVDPQALTVIVIVFALASLLTTIVALRLTGTLRLYARQSLETASPAEGAAMSVAGARANDDRQDATISSRQNGITDTPARATAISHALSQVVRNERSAASAMANASGIVGQNSLEGNRNGRETAPTGFGATGRRLAVRKTRSAARRDKAR